MAQKIKKHVQEDSAVPGLPTGAAYRRTFYGLLGLGVWYLALAFSGLVSSGGH